MIEGIIDLKTEVFPFKMTFGNFTYDSFPPFYSPLNTRLHDESLKNPKISKPDFKVQ